MCENMCNVSIKNVPSTLYSDTEYDIRDLFNINGPTDCTWVLYIYMVSKDRLVNYGIMYEYTMLDNFKLQQIL